MFVLVIVAVLVESNVANVANVAIRFKIRPQFTTVRDTVAVAAEPLARHPPIASWGASPKFTQHGNPCAARF
ncbi:MAG TPA: hypothetical protein VLU54_06140 [Casimicrobiaceae bacterium]|nr:hypothetical protein [Casimicrobiaceae bacterium]